MRARLGEGNTEDAAKTAAAAARKRTALRPLTAESNLGFLLRGAILDDDADDDWDSR